MHNSTRLALFLSILLFLGKISIPVTSQVASHTIIRCNKIHHCCINMHESIDDICKAIDENLLRNLELLEEKININVQMERILRDGYIELAKAKYIRGKETISILQVPVEDERVVTLFELETKLTEEAGKIIPNFDISLKNSDNDEDEIQDPIKWFGVLVPQSLRIAQKRFQESLYLVVRAANVQSEITSVLDKLQSLYFLKHASCSTGVNVQ